MNRLSFPLSGAIVMAVFCLCNPTAFALPFHDPFDYPDGSGLAGQINSEGNAWGECGTNFAGPDILITNFNLTYPGLANSSNNAIYYGGWGAATTGWIERIALNPPVGSTPYAINNGTVYYSFVFRVDNLAGLDAGGGFICGLNNQVGPQGAQLSVICARVYLHLDPDNTSTGYQIGIGKSPAARLDASYATNRFVVEETNFVVVSYTADGNKGSNDFAQIWINPDPSTFGAAVPPPPTTNNYVGYDFGTSGAGADAVRSFAFRGGNQFVPMIIADELRIGPTWACVTPPTNAPAPASVPLEISLADANAVISWPTNAACFALQSSPSLESNVWTTVYGNFVVAGDKFVITNALSGDSLFYRLKQF